VRRGGPTPFLRDNLEAFAVAIAMALVIRHYCLEAFRIPTKSMMPTLLGDEPNKGLHGDRILVDKYVYLRRDPRRYEVIVFQYPLNRNKNFIKRLVGLPGEWLRVVDGDIWVSTDDGETWAIQRKPAGTQEQLFFPYYPEPIEYPGAFADRDNWQRDPGWEISERARRFQVDADGPSRLRFDRQVAPYDEGHNPIFLEAPFCGDVRVRFDLKVERAGMLTVLLKEHGFPHRLVLGPAESYAVISYGPNDERKYPLDLRLEDGMDLSVSFANVDDTLLVRIDGDADVGETIEFPDPPTQPHPFGKGSKGAHEIALEADGLKATLTDLAIDRDIYYDANYEAARTAPEGYHIPPGHYLVMGDNVRSSADSRFWRVAAAHLQDGTTIFWEEQPNDAPAQPARPAPGGDDAIKRVIDVDGYVRTFRNGDVLDWESGLPRPFVSHDHLVGRAFAIFWPIHIPPVYKGPTRVDLIR